MRAMRLLFCWIIPLIMNQVSIVQSTVQPPAPFTVVDEGDQANFSCRSDDPVFKFTDYISITAGRIIYDSSGGVHFDGFNVSESYNLIILNASLLYGGKYSCSGWPISTEHYGEVTVVDRPQILLAPPEGDLVRIGCSASYGCSSTVTSWNHTHVPFMELFLDDVPLNATFNATEVGIPLPGNRLMSLRGEVNYKVKEGDVGKLIKCVVSVENPPYNRSESTVLPLLQPTTVLDTTPEPITTVSTTLIASTTMLETTIQLTTATTENSTAHITTDNMYTPQETTTEGPVSGAAIFKYDYFLTLLLLMSIIIP